MKNGRLIRGVNAPIKFVSNENDCLELQKFDDTLIENWPFLKENIVRRRTAGENRNDAKKIMAADILTAYQFPFLRKYINTTETYQEDVNEKWGLLKSVLLMNKIDMNNKSVKSVEDEFLNEMDKI